MRSVEKRDKPKPGTGQASQPLYPFSSSHCFQPIRKVAISTFILPLFSMPPLVKMAASTPNPLSDLLSITLIPDMSRLLLG